MKFLILALALLCGACGDPIIPTPPAPKPPIETPSEASPEARIAALELRVAKATAEKDEIGRLSALKDLIAEKLRQNEAETGKLKLEYRASEKALEAERINAAQAKVWWFVGIMGLAALGLAALAIFVPSVSRWAVRGAIACGAVSALAVFFAWLLPYLFWIGLGVLVIGAIAALTFWRLDAKSRDQVVQAFDQVKGQVPNYKEVFRGVIDSDADAHLDKVRSRLGLKPKA